LDLEGEPRTTGAEFQGTLAMWDWIADEGATTFSY